MDEIDAIVEKSDFCCGVDAKQQEEIKGLKAKLEEIRKEFPQLDTPDIYDESYCCEWNISQERKRLHKILDS